MTLFSGLTVLHHRVHMSEAAYAVPARGTGRWDEHGARVDRSQRLRTHELDTGQEDQPGAGRLPNRRQPPMPASMAMRAISMRSMKRSVSGTAQTLARCSSSGWR